MSELEQWVDELGNEWCDAAPERRAEIEATLRERGLIVEVVFDPLGVLHVQIPKIITIRPNYE